MLFIKDLLDRKTYWTKQSHQSQRRQITVKRTHT